MEMKITPRKGRIVCRLLSVYPYWGQSVDVTYIQGGGQQPVKDMYLRGRKVS